MLLQASAHMRWIAMGDVAMPCQASLLEESRTLATGKPSQPGGSLSFFFWGLAAISGELGFLCFFEIQRGKLFLQHLDSMWFPLLRAACFFAALRNLFCVFASLRDLLVKAMLLCLCRSRTRPLVMIEIPP